MVTATAVRNHLVDTLRAMTKEDASPLFERVDIYDDLDSYRQTAPKQLAEGKYVAGVIAGEVERGKAIDNADDHSERLPVEILYSYTVKRAPGADESAATEKMEDLAQLIRDQLTLDRSRGGLCGFTMMGGELMRETEVDGVARLVDTTPDQAIYTAALPARCGWNIPAA